MGSSCVLSTAPFVTTLRFILISGIAARLLLAVGPAGAARMVLKLAVRVVARAICWFPAHSLPLAGPLALHISPR